MNSHWVSSNRGVSPVIGVVLLIAISVVLVTIATSFIFSSADSIDSAPQTQLDVQTYDTGSSSAVQVLYSSGAEITPQNTNQLRLYVNNTRAGTITVTEMYNSSNANIFPTSSGNPINIADGKSSEITVEWIGGESGNSETIMSVRVSPN